jgi:uncharacterized protein YkwD
MGNDACIPPACNYSCTLRAGRANTGSILCATLAASLTLIAGSSATAPALAASGGAAACSDTVLRPSASNLETTEQATLCLVNRIRATHRLRLLRGNQELAGVADSQVSSMVRRDWFADVRPTGQTPLTLVGGTGYKAHAATIAVGQNIAWGTGSMSTPAHIVSEWMASPPHRAIILAAEFRDAGVAITPTLPGVLRVGRSGATYAMEFGVRRR